jgi:hypothetical protein
LETPAYLLSSQCTHLGQPNKLELSETTQEEQDMNTKMRSGLMFAAAIAIGSFALAAPTFKFGKTDKANMMMGKNDVIEIAAYPKFKLLARNITAKSATLIYQGKDAHAPFEFYEAALIKDGWKSSDAMAKGDAMAGDAMAKGDAMAGDTMAGKPADAMAGKGDAMAGKGDAMAGKGDAMAGKGDAMAGKGDAMAGEAMMMAAKHSVTKFTNKTYTITLDSKLVGDRVTVEFDLK